MKTVIIGGASLVGRVLGEILRSNGHCAVVAESFPGADVLAGAQLMIDVRLPPSLPDDALLAFCEQSTRQLLGDAAAAGVSHYVALSVVGAERLPASGYMRARHRQELLVSEGSVPWSIVRATQYYESLGAIAEAGICKGEIYLSPVAFQPMAARDVAAALAEVVLAPPLCGVREIAGPRCYSMAKLVQHFLKCSNDPRAVIPDYDAPFLGAVLDKHSLLPMQQPHLGSTDFETWLGGFLAAERMVRQEES